MKVSVVIPVHNQASRLRLTLAALECQSDVTSDDYEIIVVDDESTDGALSVVAAARDRGQYFTKYATCRSGGARGVPRNIGINLARGEVILFIDADALPGRNLVAGHLAAHAVPSRVCLGDIYVLPDTEFLADPADGTILSNRESQKAFVLPVDDVRRGIFDKTLLALAEKGGYPGHSRWHRQLEELLMETDVPFAWVSAIPHNLSISRRFLTQVGLFDSSLLHMEGWDLGIRAAEKGCAFCFARGARTFHLFHHREQDVVLQNTRDARAVLMQRYPNASLDLIHLWFHAALGDPYLRSELNLQSWQALGKTLGDPKLRSECQQLYRLWNDLNEPLSPLTLQLGLALNSSLARRT